MLTGSMDETMAARIDFPSTGAWFENVPLINHMILYL
jgi:hypothetical protein